MFFQIVVHSDLQRGKRGKGRGEEEGQDKRREKNDLCLQRFFFLFICVPYLTLKLFHAQFLSVPGDPRMLQHILSRISREEKKKEGEEKKKKKIG